MSHQQCVFLNLWKLTYAFLSLTQDNIVLSFLRFTVPMESICVFVTYSFLPLTNSHFSVIVFSTATSFRGAVILKYRIIKMLLSMKISSFRGWVIYRCCKIINSYLYDHLCIYLTNYQLSCVYRTDARDRSPLRRESNTMTLGSLTLQGEDSALVLRQADKTLRLQKNQLSKILRM